MHVTEDDYKTCDDADGRREARASTRTRNAVELYCHTRFALSAQAPAHTARRHFASIPPWTLDSGGGKQWNVNGDGDFIGRIVHEETIGWSCIHLKALRTVTYKLDHDADGHRRPSVRLMWVEEVQASMRVRWRRMARDMSQ